MKMNHKMLIDQVQILTGEMLTSGQIDVLGCCPAGIDPLRAGKAEDGRWLAWLDLTEAERLDLIRRGATPPEVCGPDVVAAPARGAMRVVTPRRIEGNASVRDGHLARDRMEVADVFDLMHVNAREVADRRGTAFVPPFTPGQVAVARHYRALVERHDAGGMKCASLEGRAGGGSGGGFMDAFLDEGAEIARLRDRIGTGVALSLRRIRPSMRGERRPITARALVDAVCLGGQTVTEVLVAYDWSNDGKHRASARTALAACLDRMQGYRCAMPQNVD